ncbi:MAG: hypothetical protein ACO39U_08070 [Bacteroidia bacterium]
MTKIIPAIFLVLLAPSILNAQIEQPKPLTIQNHLISLENYQPPTWRLKRSYGYRSKQELSNIMSSSLRLGAEYPLIGLNYERLLNPNLGLEASIAMFGAFAGANVYYPSFQPGKIAFKLGVMHGAIWEFYGGFEATTYIPIGLSYFSNWRYVLSLDCGPLWVKYDNVAPGFSVKLGWAF